MLQTCPQPPAFPVTGCLLAGPHMLSMRPVLLPTSLFNREQPSRSGYLIVATFLSDPSWVGGTVSRLSSSLLVPEGHRASKTPALLLLPIQLAESGHTWQRDLAHILPLSFTSSRALGKDLAAMILGVLICHPGPRVPPCYGCRVTVRQAD